MNISERHFQHFSRPNEALLPDHSYPMSSDPKMARAFADIREKNMYLLATKNSPLYRFGKFLQATIGGDPEAARICRNLKIPMAKAEGETIPGFGGYMVPEELVPVITSLRDAYGVLRGNARRFRLRFGGIATAPQRVSGPVAAWTSEGAQLSESSANYDSVGLAMKKLAVMVKASTELEEDAIEAWAADIADAIGSAFAQAEDDAGFYGTGDLAHGHITGIEARLNDGAHGASKITAAAGHNTYGTLDATDLGALIGAIPKRALRNAKIYISQTGYGNGLARIAGASGGLVATIGPDGDLQANYLGLPVELVPSLPTLTTTLTGKLMAVAGDMQKGIILGERRAISIRRLSERFADTDQIGILGTERVDVNFHDSGDATNSGALVGLFAP